MKNLPIVPLIMICFLYGENLTAMDNNYFSATKNICIKDTTPKPVVVPEKISLQSFSVLYTRDTAEGKTLGRMFEIDFVRLFSYARRHDLVGGRPMAFYISRQHPVILEVTIEINRMPDSLPGNIQYRVVEGGEAIVAHYKGPYEEIEMAYNALSAWLKTNNRKPKGRPFEIYLNDPGTIKDKYELKTEVYQMLQ